MNLDLPGVQGDLLNQLIATNKPVIAALIHGRPVTFLKHDLLPNLHALLAMWRPGEEGGSALWDILSGRVAPSGRLSQSWVRAVGQVRSQASPWYSLLQGDFDQVDYNGDVIAGSSREQASWAPQFPFGYGLSFTTFKTELVGAVTTATSIQVTVKVTNTGKVASKQVVGVYFSMTLSMIVRYRKLLLGFGKTQLLSPSASQVLLITSPVGNLASYDPFKRASVVEKGLYTITVGPDSNTVSGTASISINSTIFL